MSADPDYTDKCNDRRSVSDVAVMLGDTIVRDSCIMQHSVALPTSEAEYVAMTHGAKTTLPTKAMLVLVQPFLSGSAIAM